MGRRAPGKLPSVTHKKEPVESSQPSESEVPGELFEAAPVQRFEPPQVVRKGLISFIFVAQPALAAPKL